jgi:CheY-like chemotaxis protein
VTARILVVEDQPELAELLQVVLEGEGHLRLLEER